MKANNYLFVIILLVLTTATLSAFPIAVSKNATFDNRESNPTIIELLQNGESYFIEITSVGCFGGTRQTITISKDADVLTASYPDFSKILSEKDIEAFITFELQLRGLSAGGCSNVDTYVLRYGNETFQTSDGTCSWNGGKKLLEKIS